MMHEVSKEWLESLKVGDTVVVYSWGAWHKTSLNQRVVTRLTPKFVEVGGILYSKTDGYPRGRDSYMHSLIVPLTEELKVKIADTQMRDKYKRFIKDFYDTNKFDKLTTNQLERLATLIKEVRAENESSKEGISTED